MEPGDQGAQATASAEKTPDLAATNLAEFFGTSGSLSQHLPGYELRPSQLEMAESVKRALLAGGHALMEAPTGTGKSIAYLVPAILSGKTVVVATANKSLQHQLFTKDIPFLRKVMQQPISAVVVKGRSNYVCTLKWEKELVEQQAFAMYDREDEQVTYMREWLTTTDTGDLDDLPFVLTSDLRPRLVSFADDCLQRDCRYYHDDCWVNRMRDEAAEAQVLITNHHLLLNALQLGMEGQRILPPAAIYIVDEAHQLEQTATSVFETSVTDYTVTQLLRRSVYREHVDEDELDELELLNTQAFQEVALLSRDSSFRLDDELEAMKQLSSALRKLARKLKEQSPYEGTDNAAFGDITESSSGADGHEGEDAEARRMYELSVTALNSTADSLSTVASSKMDDVFVRYAVRVFDRRHVSLEIHAAPIEPAELLAYHLFQPENEDGPVARSVICTSATLTTNGHFEHFKQRCGVGEVCEESVLPAVFDYPRQTLLYQPALPAYDWRAADTYYAAVAEEIERLLEVSRGRALCLFTSWSGLQHVSDRLQSLDSPVVWPLRAQGDAPRNALLEWFTQTPYSVLLATRSFWEGVDIPGEDLSLVVLDKMPFPTPGDPLHSARMSAVEESGGSSFSEYMTPLMTLSLKQGFGRLIRRSTDWGVVAILDERLSSKGYGRRARGDLPPAKLTRSFRDVYQFFQRKMGTNSDFAVNVWARPAADSAGDGTVWWRCRVLRMHDAKADELVGNEDAMSTEAAEVLAALHGLRNLSDRIDNAGRTPASYSVEVRCSESAQQWLAGGEDCAELRSEWESELARWKSVSVLGLAPISAGTPLVRDR